MVLEHHGLTWLCLGLKQDLEAAQLEPWKPAGGSFLWVS